MGQMGAGMLMNKFNGQGMGQMMGQMGAGMLMNKFNARQQAKNEKMRMDMLYPGTNPWERLGGNPGSSQSIVPGQQAHEIAQKQRELDNNIQIATIQANAQKLTAATQALTEYGPEGFKMVMTGAVGAVGPSAADHRGESINLMQSRASQAKALTALAQVQTMTETMNFSIRETEAQYTEKLQQLLVAAGVADIAHTQQATRTSAASELLTSQQRLTEAHRTGIAAIGETAHQSINFTKLSPEDMLRATAVPTAESLAKLVVQLGGAAAFAKIVTASKDVKKLFNNVVKLASRNK